MLAMQGALNAVDEAACSKSYFHWRRTGYHNNEINVTAQLAFFQFLPYLDHLFEFNLLFIIVFSVEND
jgi:hypothetical protein